MSSAELKRGEKGRGKNDANFNNLITKQPIDAVFQKKIDIPFMLLIALTNCAYLPSAWLASKNHALYSEGKSIKGCLS
jgi:hypothetical protein